LRIGVLPEKGADIFELIYKSADGSEDIQFLMQTPWGLKRLVLSPRLIFWKYEGGWQELFPMPMMGASIAGRIFPSTARSRFCLAI